MKTGVLILLLIMGLSSCSSVITEDSEITPADQKKIISETDKYRDDLESQLYSLKKITRYVYMDEKKVQVISYFSDEEQIKKMSLTIHGNNDRKYIEYVFLNNDVLLYVWENDNQTYSPRPEQNLKSVQSLLNEYYFSDNMLVYWLQEHQIRSASLYKIKSREIFSDLEMVLNELSKTPVKSSPEN